MVVLTHVSNALDEHNAGYFDGWIGGAGVDIFFVISGYIMARLSDVPATGFTIAISFLTRRLSRIVPIYWLATLLILAIWWVTKADMLTGLRSDNVMSRTFKSLLFSPNPIVVVGWTLFYEMAYYCLIATSLTLPWRREVRFGFVATVLLAAALCFIWPSGIANPVTWPRSAMITEFIVGMGIYLFTKDRQFPCWIPLSMIALGVVSLWVVRYDHTINHGHPNWVLGAAAIAFGFISAERMVRWPKFGVKLGDASYSVYLIHLYVIIGLNYFLWEALDNTFGNALAAAVLTILAVVISTVASLIVFKAVERPLTTYFQKCLFSLRQRVLFRLTK